MKAKIRCYVRNSFGQAIGGPYLNETEAPKHFERLCEVYGKQMGELFVEGLYVDCVDINSLRVHPKPLANP